MAYVEDQLHSSNESPNETCFRFPLDLFDSTVDARLEKDRVEMSSGEANDINVTLG